MPRRKVEYNSDFKSYRGNTLLKKINEEVEWTPELIEEYVRCSRDPVYFIETYVKIINLDRGLVKFILRDYQKDIVHTALDNRFTIVATARQVGKSVTVTALILWYILFNADKVVALMANKGETAREILGRVHTSYENLPKWIQQGVREWNKGSIHLENGSRVIAAATSSSAIRGYSINLLFLDECAFIENWEQFESSVLPTVSSSAESKIIMVSTPHGLNHFYKYWQDAHRKPDELGYNGYQPIRVNWTQVPDRNEAWHKLTLEAMSGNTDKFNQEYGVEFLGSSGTLIAGWKLKELVYNAPIEFKDGLSQYARPVENHIYCLVADVSHGKGLDYSAFHCIDITKMPFQIVTTYRNNWVTPNDYAAVIHSTARAYNSAYVLIETNDIGYHIGQLLISDFEYDNLLYTVSAGRSGKRVTTAAGPGIEIGIKTSKLIKSVGCTLLKLLIEQNQLPVCDFHTIEELSRFSKKGDSYEAEEGCHDDTVMSLVLFAWLSGQDYFKDISDVNTLKNITDTNEDQFEADMVPFGFVHDNVEEDPATLLQKHYDSWLFPRDADEDDPPAIEVIHNF